MTIGELLDGLAFKEGDFEGDFRTAALRWLNLARSTIADSGPWRGSFAGSATITTDGRASGVYPLVVGSTVYDRIAGQTIFDQNADNVLWQKRLEDIDMSDPGRDDTSTSPSCWADMGYNSSGQRQILIWPVPTSGVVIRFAGHKLLTDLTAANEGDSVDSYFGPVSVWAHCFRDGIEYYYLRDLNEDGGAIMGARAQFLRSINQRKSRDGVTSGLVTSLDPVKGQGHYGPVRGIMDPSHYSNR